MEKNSNLINKYKEIYSRIIKLSQDREIFPEMNDEKFKEFVSQKDWMGVPSFAITKKEMTTSDQGHIGLWVKDGEITIDLWFNGIKAVNRFVNILNPFLKKEKDQFINLIKNLDKRYRTVVYYTEKYFAGPAEWERVSEITCNDLTDKRIEELLETIEQTKGKRDKRQKEIPKHEIATIAVSLAERDISKVTDKELMDILEKIAELTRITHQLKSLKDIKKIEKEKKEDLKMLKARKNRIEMNIEDTTEEDYNNVLEGIRNLEEN